MPKTGVRPGCGRCVWRASAVELLILLALFGLVALVDHRRARADSLLSDPSGRA